MIISQGKKDQVLFQTKNLQTSLTYPGDLFLNVQIFFIFSNGEELLLN
jgi:hypothetical protein